MSRWRITCIPKFLLPNIAFLRLNEVTDVTSIVGGESIHVFVIPRARRGQFRLLPNSLRRDLRAEQSAPQLRRGLKMHLRCCGAALTPPVRSARDRDNCVRLATWRSCGSGSIGRERLWHCYWRFAAIFRRAPRASIGACTFAIGDAQTQLYNSSGRTSLRVIAIGTWRTVIGNWRRSRCFWVVEHQFHPQAHC